MKFERLDRRITLQRLAKQTNATSGEVEQVVAEEILVAAEFRSLVGAESFQAGREVSKGYASFVIRYFPGVDAQNWRIKDWASRVWDIKGEPREIGRRGGLELFSELRGS